MDGIRTETISRIIDGIDLSRSVPTTSPSPRTGSIPGKKHPYQRLIDFMREIMLEMGFVEIKGQIVQSSFWNFDALFQPQDHPAREMQDTFYLDSLADIPDYYPRQRDA